MASLSDSQRITDAITETNRLEATASAEIERAKAQVDSARTALETAESHLAQVESARESEIKDFQDRRQRLAALFGQPLDPNDPLLQTPTLQKTSTTKKVPQSKSKSVAPASASPAATSVERQGKPRQPLSAVPTIVPYGDGDEWIELRCPHPECGTNCNHNGQNFPSGLNGIQKHFNKTHEGAVTLEGFLEECKYRTVPNEEVERIIAGEATIEKVLGKTVSEAQANNDTPQSGVKTGPRKQSETRVKQETPVPTKKATTNLIQDGGVTPNNTLFQYLQTAPTVIAYRNSDEWFEIRCSGCKANCSESGRFFSGVAGLHRHYNRVHDPKSASQDETVDNCKIRPVSNEEIELIKAGSVSIEKVVAGGNVKTNGQRKRPAPGENEDESTELPPKKKNWKRDSLLAKTSKQDSDVSMTEENDHTIEESNGDLNGEIEKGEDGVEIAAKSPSISDFPQSDIRPASPAFGKQKKQMEWKNKRNFDDEDVDEYQPPSQPKRVSINSPAAKFPKHPRISSIQQDENAITALNSSFESGSGTETETEDSED